MRLLRLNCYPTTSTESRLAAVEAPQQWQAFGWQQQRQPPAAALPATACGMRQRGLALLQQGAAGMASGRIAAAASSTSGVRQRLAPMAASLHEGNGTSTSNGSLAPPRLASSACAPSDAAGSSSLEEAAIDAAAPPSWMLHQRVALRESVRAKMAALQAHVEGNTRRLWNLRSEPQQLAALGISVDELQSLVLVRYGTGQEALQQLVALVAAKQVAVMEGGAEHLANLDRRRQGLRTPAAPPPAARAGAQPQAGVPAQLPHPAQQQQQQPEYVPSWRTQQQAQQAAANQQYRQVPAYPIERTAPASSQVASDSSTFAERRAQWQQKQQQQQQQQQLLQLQCQWQGQQGSAQKQKQAVAPVRASIRDLLNERRIRLPQYAPGSYNHVPCPECQGGDKGEKSLSVTIEEGSESAVWNCFRAKCGWTGGVNTQQGTSKAYRQYTNDSGFAVTAMRKRKEESPLRPNPKFDAELSPVVVDFFAARGISTTTLARNRVAQETLGDGSTAIAFPYYRDSQLINIKYRSLGEKKFWQVKGAEKVLFGLDDVVGTQEIVMVEGEMDKLALEEAGFKNVVSVPDGAPARVKEGEVPPADQDTKFSYLWNCRAWLDQAAKVVIATDNDAPGDALAEELARRLGRERCWRVRWPLNEEDHQYAADATGVQYMQQAATPQEAEAASSATSADPAAAATGGNVQPEQQQGNKASSSEAGSSREVAAEALQLRVQPAYYRKDANEVLMRDGADMLRAFLENAEPFPIRGLLRFHEYYDDIMKYYRLEHKDGQGRSTGWPSLDRYYKVVPGELTIVTGVPNSGKSEWIDALLANLAEQHDWCFALCSMEKKATDHARQLVEKYIGKPFFDLPYARGVRRMSERELDEGLDWIDDRFHLVRYEDDALPAVDWVLDVARAAVYRYGIRGLVIDPYNELDHQRPASMNETEYVSQMLTKVKRFAQTTGVHVWFVAHPRQMREWKGQAPNLYDISGSAHFINKADNGIVVHRDRDPEAPDQRQVQILVRKVRNKAAGTIGDAVLEYERVNGRYIDPDSPTGGPRTAQRINFEELVRQERLAQMRAEQAEAADAAASMARVAGVPQGGGPRTAAQPVAATAAASGMGLASFAWDFSPATDAPQRAAPPPPPVKQQQRQQPAPVQQQQPQARPTAADRLEELQQELDRPAPRPSMTWRLDGTMSNDPVTDEQETEEWLRGKDF